MNKTLCRIWNGIYTAIAAFSIYSLVCQKSLEIKANIDFPVEIITGEPIFDDPGDGGERLNTLSQLGISKEEVYTTFSGMEINYDVAIDFLDVFPLNGDYIQTVTRAAVEATADPIVDRLETGFSSLYKSATFNKFNGIFKEFVLNKIKINVGETDAAKYANAISADTYKTYSDGTMSFITDSSTKTLEWAKSKAVQQVNAIIANAASSMTDNAGYVDNEGHAIVLTSDEENTVKEGLVNFLDAMYYVNGDNTRLLADATARALHKMIRPSVETPNNIVLKDFLKEYVISSLGSYLIMEFGAEYNRFLGLALIAIIGVFVLPWLIFAIISVIRIFSKKRVKPRAWIPLVFAFPQLVLGFVTMSLMWFKEPFLKLVGTFIKGSYFAPFLDMMSNGKFSIVTMAYFPSYAYLGVLVLAFISIFFTRKGKKKEEA